MLIVNPIIAVMNARLVTKLSYRLKGETELKSIENKIRYLNGLAILLKEANPKEKKVIIKLIKRTHKAYFPGRKNNNPEELINSWCCSRKEGESCTQVYVFEKVEVIQDISKNLRVKEIVDEGVYSTSSLGFVSPAIIKEFEKRVFIIKHFALKK